MQKKLEVRERGDFIHRFWVMQAMFEGLTVLALIAAEELKYSFGDEFQGFYWGALSILILILTWRCMVAAKENSENQIKEVILSYYSYIKSV